MKGLHLSDDQVYAALDTACSGRVTMDTSPHYDQLFRFDPPRGEANRVARVNQRMEFSRDRFRNDIVLGPNWVHFYESGYGSYEDPLMSHHEEAIENMDLQLLENGGMNVNIWLPPHLGKVRDLCSMFPGHYIMIPVATRRKAEADSTKFVVSWRELHNLMHNPHSGTLLEEPILSQRKRQFFERFPAHPNSPIREPDAVQTALGTDNIHYVDWKDFAHGRSEPPGSTAGGSSSSKGPAAPTHPPEGTDYDAQRVQPSVDSKRKADQVALSRAPLQRPRRIELTPNPEVHPVASVQNIPGGPTTVSIQVNIPANPVHPAPITGPHDQPLLRRPRL